MSIKNVFTRIFFHTLIPVPPICFCILLKIYRQIEVNKGQNRMCSNQLEYGVCGKLCKTTWKLLWHIILLHVSFQYVQDHQREHDIIS